MKFWKTQFAGAIAILGIALSAVPAMAGPTFQFSSSVGTQPGGVGTITLKQLSATSVKVDVDLLPGYGFINTGGPHTPFAFNLSVAGGLSVNFLTPVGGNFTGGPLHTGAAAHFSLNTLGGANTPFGTFGIAIDSSARNGSSRGYFGDLSLVLNRPSGIDTKDFVQNADGYYFSADLSNGSNTGAQAWGIRTCLDCTPPPPPPPPVPEPASILLLGTGLLGLAVSRRRKAKT